jgi:hypothetical protein
MEHFGFLIAPAASIPFCLAFEIIRRRHRLLSHENIRETKAVATSLCFTKIADKVNLWRKNKDLRCFLRLDYAYETLCYFHSGIVDM